MNKFRLYLLNLVLIISTALFVIPDLSIDEKSFETESGTLHKAYIETYKYKPSKSLTKVDRERLILITVDRLEKRYLIGDQYSDHWGKLLDTSSIGKTLRVYCTSINSNKPIKVELDGEVIYDLDIQFKWEILIIIMTIGITAFNFYKYIKEE